MKTYVTGALCILIVVVFCTKAFCQGQATHVMQIALDNSSKDNSYVWTPFEVLKIEVETRSRGRLKVEIHSRMIGKDLMEMFAGVKDGLVHARDFAGGHLSTIYPPLQVLSIPYLFAYREIAWEVLDGPFGQMLMADMAEKTGLRPLYWIENGGFRHYSNNKRPIHSPEDMKGLIIRTMGTPLHMKIVSDLGGRPVPISWSKLYEAIESGIVDGQENSIGTFMIPHLENIQNHIVLDAHVYGIYTLLMNEAWYQSLPEDLKTILNQAKRISAAVNRGLSVSNEITGMRYLKARGVEIYKPSEDEIRMFRKLTRNSALDWLNANIDHKWVQGVLEATRAAEKKLGFEPLGSKTQ
jgi:C4-dicarboxylate-binding protein DctP